MSALAIRRLFSGLRARYHVWNGRRAYRAGRLRVAGVHLDQALANGHSSFSAHLLLGKVAYRERDMQRAMDNFRLARRADAVRYELEGFPQGFIESLAKHPTTPPRLQYRIIIEPSQPRQRSGSQRPLQAQDAVNADNLRSEGAGSDDPTQGSLGDFSSRAEKDQARSRPMFRAGEWADIDWDVEARKLFGE